MRPALRGCKIAVLFHDCENLSENRPGRGLHEPMLSLYGESARSSRHTSRVPASTLAICIGPCLLDIELGSVVSGANLGACKAEPVEFSSYTRS
jgi:hypothetical protein